VSLSVLISTIQMQPCQFLEQFVAMESWNAEVLSLALNMEVIHYGRETYTSQFHICAGSSAVHRC